MRKSSTIRAFTTKDKLAQPLNLSTTRTAWGIHETASEDIARAFRIHAAERGFDYRGATMIAFGGSGPLHAMSVASKLKIIQNVFVDFLISVEK